MSLVSCARYSLVVLCCSLSLALSCFLIRVYRFDTHEFFFFLEWFFLSQIKAYTLVVFCLLSNPAVHCLQSASCSHHQHQHHFLYTTTSTLALRFTVPRVRDELTRQLSRNTNI